MCGCKSDMEPHKREVQASEARGQRQLETDERCGWLRILVEIPSRFEEKERKKRESGVRDQRSWSSIDAVRVLWHFKTLSIARLGPQRRPRSCASRKRQTRWGRGQAEALAKEFGIPYYEASAKLNLNVAATFEQLAERIVRRKLAAGPRPGKDEVVLTRDTPSKKGCC